MLQRNSGVLATDMGRNISKPKDEEVLAKSAPALGRNDISAAKIRQVPDSGLLLRQWE